MAGTWERRGTVTVTHDSKIVTGVGTYWTDAKNGPQIGNAFYGPNGQAHEVALIKSATELWLADEYKGATESGVKYQIDTTRVDSVPGLASRVAAAIGYAQGQYDNLDKWTQGGVDEDVTLTSPNGGSVTVPSLPKMGKYYASVSEALPYALRAEEAAGRAASAAAATADDRSDVTIKAGQAAASASTAIGAKDTAVAAADTATQKAASAATHDASAQDAATRAENAASAVVGAVLDGGECDLSSGIYPQPITVAGKKYSTIWYVATAGSVSGVSFDVGDLLRYTTAKEGYYFKVDAKDDVYSVNGEKGPVTITPEKIGAEKAGTAQLLIDQHSAKTKAHPISGVDGLLEALDYKYSPENKPPSDFLPGEPRMFETRLQLSKRGAEYHPLDGQTVPRSGDAALLAAIIAGDVPSCTDADWLADPLKRSNYTLGDGSTTIRLPDRNGKSSGSAGAVFARGDGIKAPLAGAIHGDATRRVTTSITLHWADEANIIGAVSGAGKGARGNGTKYRSTFNLPVTDGAVSFGEVSLDNSLQVPTADENRPTSISQVWAVKR